VLNLPMVGPISLQGPQSTQSNSMSRSVPATFQFVGDRFNQAWYFNRFRCDPLDENTLVTTALVSSSGQSPVVNGFVLSKRDIEANRDRSMEYLAELDTSLASADAEVDSPPLFAASPARIYPVNLMNLSRMDQIGEISLYRYSMHTLLTTTRELAAKGSDKAVAKIADKRAIPCYPVVVFRCSAKVQLAFLKELFA
jgi:hypothetical protein